MKKLQVIVLSALILGATVIPSFAGNWDFYDHRVELHYWDRTDWGVAYSGVVNQTSYERYSACIGKSDNSLTKCSRKASQNEYVQADLNQNINSHFHFLSDSANRQQYVYR